MKSIRMIAVVLLFFLPVTGSNADKVYTWTDEKGVTHISETPPPPNATNRDVIEYVPKTKTEESAIREKKQLSRELAQKEQIAAEAKETRQRAEEARAKANELKAAADQLFQQSEEFKMKTSNTIRRWQLNKSTRLKLEQEAAEAQKKAMTADEEASQLEKRAQQAEKRLQEMLSEEESLAEEKPAPTLQ